MIKVNDTIPAGTLQQLTASGMENHSTDELFANKKTVMFAVPGAFTPTCSVSHLPGYVVKFDEFKAKGVDQIICLSVNDAFVMEAWGNAQNAENIMMLADGDGSFTKLLGLEMDTAGFGGIRSQRYAMVIENGVVTHLNIEAPKEFEVSKAESVLAVL
ncbi:peroxiredoxin [Thalassotalea psychrophila]|uniref:Glutathione-dependent peroxiredoxin n=1 Tax=Thalassotalea psychrophila TaxID=3065647 RepID=A0ABY9TTV5_9GAMM|nr:peroxiredoxin [Colwelliaceae bacterium SQ149]